jgi:hypothetical protein
MQKSEYAFVLSLAVLHCWIADIDTAQQPPTWQTARPNSSYYNYFIAPLFAQLASERRVPDYRRPAALQQAEAGMLICHRHSTVN